MEQLPSFSKEISSIYFIANSPFVLYKMMKENFFIQNDLSVLDEKILIDEFKKRINTPVSTSNEIAEIYAIFIALTLKEPTRQIVSFFEDSSKIKFEWFSIIAKYYLENPQEKIEVQQININGFQQYYESWGKSIATPMVERDEKNVVQQMDNISFS